MMMMMMMMMMKSSLPRPNLICFTTTRNLFPFLNHHYLIPTKPPSSSSPRPRGLFFKVRFPTPNNSNIVRLKSSSMSSSSSPSLSEKGAQFNNNNDREMILSSTDDDHGGVIVEINTPMDSNIFTSLLRASLSHWKQQGKKGVWIKLPIHLANLIESAVKEGFYYHHAEPTYLMLVYWIPETANTLPVNATHRVGIGAFVINEKREVLVIQEKSGKFHGTGIWKFPTGVVDEGEDICDAAVREVKEETGVDTKFVEVLAFRQSHKSFFDKSDLFFMCMLQPLSSVIQKQDNEIEAAQWMPFEEYAAQPFVQKHELLKYIVNICLAKKDGEYSGFSPVPTATISSDKRNYLYLNRHGLKSQ